MPSLACSKRILLVLPRQRLAVPWSEAERERDLTLVELSEATRLLGAKVADLTELGADGPVATDVPVAPVPASRLLSAALKARAITQSAAG